MQDGDLTRMLRRAWEGDDAASTVVWEMVHKDVTAMAKSRLKREIKLKDVETSEIVSEVWVRFQKEKEKAYSSRAMFFGCIARLMHEYFIDEWRRRSRKKRWGKIIEMSLSAIAGDVLGPADKTASSAERVDLTYEALKALEKDSREAATAIRLQVLLQLSHQQIGERLGESETKVAAWLKFARKHLKSYLKNRGDAA